MNLDLADFLLGIVGAAIALFVYRLGLQQRRDSLVAAFTELHQQFWGEKIFSRVRAWIADDTAYQELDAILAKRMLGRNQLDLGEYCHLDKLDRFLNLLVRADALAQRIYPRSQRSRWQWLWELVKTRSIPEKRPHLWELLYFQYWLNAIVEAGRHRFWLYYNEHYEGNSTPLPFTVKDAVYEDFKYEAFRLEEHVR